MNIAYIPILFMIFIFVWIITNVTVIPVLSIIIEKLDPYFWYKVTERPVIKEVKEVGKYVHRHILIKVFIIAFCVCGFIISCLYVVYYIAKNILIPDIITAGIGNDIVSSVVILPFVEIGLFPLIDSIFAFMLPSAYVNPTGTIPDAIRTFSVNFVTKVRSVDIAPVPMLNAKTTPLKNPNLTEEQNKVVNKKYDKCIKDTTVQVRGGKDSFALLRTSLINTKSKILCDIQRLKDSMEIKNTK